MSFFLNDRPSPTLMTLLPLGVIKKISVFIISLENNPHSLSYRSMAITARIQSNYLLRPSNYGGGGHRAGVNILKNVLRLKSYFFMKFGET